MLIPLNFVGDEGRGRDFFALLAGGVEVVALAEAGALKSFTSSFHEGKHTELSHITIHLPVLNKTAPGHRR